MTESDKKLLLTDLSARLPYGIICTGKFCDACKITQIDIDARSGRVEVYYFDYNDFGVIEDCKPYLRPLSSMTEKETEKFREYGVNLIKQHNFDDSPFSNFYVMSLSIDWLNANHFDYRELIEKGLALEAPEDMYKD